MSSPPHPAMREPSYFVLAALLRGRQYGYAITQLVTELSRGRIRLAAGSLYSVIDRLVTEKLIAPAGEEIVNGRARRYYALTEAGGVALAAEATRMAQAAQIILDHRDVLPGVADSWSPSWKGTPA
jgi:DNA-binding PadR family transcriptional regulator